MAPATSETLNPSSETTDATPAPPAQQDTPAALPPLVDGCDIEIPFDTNPDIIGYAFDAVCWMQPQPDVVDLRWYGAATSFDNVSGYATGLVEIAWDEGLSLPSSKDMTAAFLREGGKKAAAGPAPLRLILDAEDLEAFSHEAHVVAGLSGNGTVSTGTTVHVRVSLFEGDVPADYSALLP